MALNPSLKYMPKYSGSDYELKVSRIKMDDKGEYIVRAINSFGSKEESAVLSVERKLPPHNLVPIIVHKLLNHGTAGAVWHEILLLPGFYINRA